MPITVCVFNEPVAFLGILRTATDTALDPVLQPLETLLVVFLDTGNNARQSYNIGNVVADLNRLLDFHNLIPFSF